MKLSKTSVFSNDRKWLYNRKNPFLRLPVSRRILTEHSPLSWARICPQNSWFTLMPLFSVGFVLSSTFLLVHFSSLLSHLALPCDSTLWQTPPPLKGSSLIKIPSIKARMKQFRVFVPVKESELLECIQTAECCLLLMIKWIVSSCRYYGSTINPKTVFLRKDWFDYACTEEVHVSS